MKFKTKSGKEINLISFNNETDLKNALAKEVAAVKQENISSYVINLSLGGGSDFKLDSTEPDRVSFSYKPLFIVHSQKEWEEKTDNIDRWIYNEYSGFIRYYENYPDKYKFIDEATRISVINEYFESLETFDKLFVPRYSPASEQYVLDEERAKRKGILSFSAYSFFTMFVLGYIFDSLPEGTTVYCVGSYGFIIYWEGINRAKLVGLSTKASEEFNSRFGTHTSIEGSGARTVKYIPVGEQTTTDRFGNTIHVGDLVISPQSNRASGSWVDPLIVERIEGDRLYFSRENTDTYHTYYMGNRCILLRSKVNKKITYGKLDWEVNS